jgi:hypothetical protein
MYALPTILFGKDKQNGTHIPGPGGMITSGDVVLQRRALLMQCMVHLMQNEESVPWQEMCQ